MTDEEIEKIIKSNMMLTMDFAGIRADFEEKLKRAWVGLTDEEIETVYANCNIWDKFEYERMLEAKLKEKNT